MHKTTKLICIILVLAIFMAVPASAETMISPRGSDYFHMFSTYIYMVNNTQFQVWFDLVALDGMDELGSSRITVQRSSDGTNWQNMFTYLPEYYPQMIAYNTGSYMNYVPYHGTLGYYYRAVVTFYAKNNEGTGKMFRYTQTVYLDPNA